MTGQWLTLLKLTCGLIFSCLFGVSMTVCEIIHCSVYITMSFMSFCSVSNEKYCTLCSGF